MGYRARRWLNAIAIDDPIAYRLATILQLAMLVVLAAAIITLPLAFTASATLTGQLLNATANLLALPFTAVALTLLRRGQVALSVVVFTAGFLLAAAIGFVPIGVRGGSGNLVVLAIPITLAGLLASRRGLWLVGVMSVLIVITIAVLEHLAPHWVGFAPPAGDPTINIVGMFTVTVGVLIVCFLQFGTALRDALHAALAREEELERLRAALETQVSERTAALEATVSQLQASQTTIREVGTPILPVAPGVLVAPLIGVLDSDRTASVSARILGEVQEQRAHAVIFDITGVPLVDTQIAQDLLRMAGAIRLLGAQVVVVGIRAEVARTMVTLGVDLGSIVTFPNLQAALQALTFAAMAPMPYSGSPSM
jgi:anti-anti-sigma regulatory factor